MFCLGLRFALPIYTRPGLQEETRQECRRVVSSPGRAAGISARCGGREIQTAENTEDRTGLDWMGAQQRLSELKRLTLGTVLACLVSTSTSYQQPSCYVKLGLGGAQ